MKLHFNGVNGVTGKPLLAPLQPSELVARINGDDVHELEDNKTERHIVWHKHDDEGKVLGTIDGVDETNLDEAKWGVIFHPNIPEDVKKALAPLIDWRKAGRKQYVYQPGETSYQFRMRNGQGPGVVNPDKLPYYLLIVGGPEQIPFSFQYNLDSQHAVGRLDFDEPSYYSRYVASVINYEDSQKQTDRQSRIAFFAPQNQDDIAVYHSSEFLVRPLVTHLEGRELERHGGGKATYQVEHVTGEDATKPKLIDILSRTEKKPSFLFTATHGVGFPYDHDLQETDQGALVCQEWPGEDAWGENPIPDHMYVAGRHLKDMSFEGLFVFSFACYSAGTPHLKDFPYFEEIKPEELASRPFVAALPKEMLAQGALGFIGHVERAWDFSFLQGGPAPVNIDTFSSTLQKIMRGIPIGHAFEPFNQRYSDLHHALYGKEGMLPRAKDGKSVDMDEIVALWITHCDARSYVLLGDPFVHLNPQ